MSAKEPDTSRPTTIELVFPANLTPRQRHIHGCQIVRLIQSLIDEQTCRGLSALHDGDQPEMPFRFSVDFRHASLITELASGGQLIDKEGRAYSRAEVIRLLRRSLLLPLLDDVQVDGQSIMPARRTSFFSRWK